MNVLLVEDSDEVSGIIVEYLHELGHRAVAMATAEGAIAQLREMKFDAVITDYSLPGMSGIQFARELCKEYPSLPVVLCSGNGALNTEFLTRNKLSTVLVLPKPFDLANLASVLGEAIALSRGQIAASEFAPSRPKTSNR